LTGARNLVAIARRGSDSGATTDMEIRRRGEQRERVEDLTDDRELVLQIPDDEASCKWVYIEKDSADADHRDCK
jgi:hypothetical protein